MESFARKNWLGMFLVFLFGSLIVLGIIAIDINDGLAKFLEKSEGDDKRMDVIGSIFGTSVAIASALVAIILARIALVYSENESKREFKAIIEKRIVEIREINSEIMYAAEELRFVAIDSFSNISGIIDKKREMIEKNNEIDLNELNKYIENRIIEEVFRNKEPLKKFSNAIKKLETNPIIKQHYINKFDYNEQYYDKQYLEMEKDNSNATLNPKKIKEIAVQMENKYIENLPFGVIMNHFQKLSENNTLNKYDKIDKHWIFFSFLFSYGMGFCILNGRPRLASSITALDILINLPSTRDYIDFSKEYDKDIDDETAKKIIMTITGAIEKDGKIKDLDDEIKVILRNVRNILIDDFDDILCL